MNGGPVPFLWLCGPSGVGKSSVGWEIYDQLGRAGVAAGYADADQLGMCYPAPADDPDNHRVKAQGLGAVWPHFVRSGIERFVFSGGVDTPAFGRWYTAVLPGASVTVCRLRVSPGEHRARFLGRGWRPELVEEMVRDSERAGEEAFADLIVDTDGLDVPAVARLVRERAGAPW